jgi:hypothetical protein
MKKILSLFAAAALAFGPGADVQAAKKVHTIGDSTMANYDENATVTRGWCQYLQQFLTGIEVNNRGKNGASSKSFYLEPSFWTTVKNQMQPGDYVLIQFAHNDEKTGGMDGDEVKAYYNSIGDNAAAAATDYRGTNPSTTYKDYLRKYVDETRALGCEPVLVGPVCRMYFSGNTIRRNGRHDLGDSFSVITGSGILEKQSVPASDHTMDYVQSMKDVAAEKGVPFIDLTTATADLYLSYGDSDCHSILGDGAGSTHLSATGAALIARRFVQLASDAGVMAEYANLSGELGVSPADGSMGQGYVGQTLQKEFLVSGFSLEPAAGNVTVSATEAIELSADGGVTWSSDIAMPYEWSTLVGKFQVRMTIDKAGENIGAFTISAPSGISRTVTVTGTGVELSGGVEVNAYWRLEKDDACELTGPAEPLAESWHGMELQRYSNPNANTVWPDWTGFDASRKTQRNVIEGGAWPDGEIDEVSTRYIEFGLKAMPGTTLSVDEISCFLCGCGGNGMCVNVWYSVADDFSDARQIFHYEKLPSNNMQYIKEVPVLSLDGGQTLRLRFYPWYNGAATGKTICLSDIRIHGYASDNSALAAVTAAGVVDTSYYTLQGMRVGAPAQGNLYIVRDTLSDGGVRTRKVVF